MQDKKLCFLYSFCTSYYYEHLGLHKTYDLTHLQVFLAQPILQLHFTKPCPSPIGCKQAASHKLISVFEST